MIVLVIFLFCWEKNDIFALSRTYVYLISFSHNWYIFIATYYLLVILRFRARYAGRFCCIRPISYPCCLCNCPKSWFVEKNIRYWCLVGRAVLVILGIHLALYNFRGNWWSLFKLWILSKTTLSCFKWNLVPSDEFQQNCIQFFLISNHYAMQICNIQLSLSLVQISRHFSP